MSDHQSLNAVEDWLDLRSPNHPHHPTNRDCLCDFVLESNRIEGIDRLPTIDELEASGEFLIGPCDIDAVLALQAVFAPGKPIRDQYGMNVRVGNYIAPLGGPWMRRDLEAVLGGRLSATTTDDPFHIHVAFEKLHPFIDGNGRTGRMVWAWKMLRSGQDPFALSFLHRFYYQTLAAA